MRSHFGIASKQIGTATTRFAATFSLGHGPQAAHYRTKIPQAGIPPAIAAFTGISASLRTIRLAPMRQFAPLGAIYGPVAT